MRSASAHLADNPSNYNPAAETRLRRFPDGHEEVALLGTARGTRGRKTFCLGSYEGVGFGVGSALPCVHFYSEELDYIRAGPGIRFRFTRARKMTRKAKRHPWPASRTGIVVARRPGPALPAEDGFYFLFVGQPLSLVHQRQQDLLGKL